MFENEKSDLSEHLVTINRVAKVVKGGRRFGIAAIMIVGDTKGRVGYGTGKAKEVPEAVRKATEDAKNKMVRVHLKDNRTLHHDVVGSFGAETRFVGESSSTSAKIKYLLPKRHTFGKMTLEIQDSKGKIINQLSIF